MRGFDIFDPRDGKTLATVPFAWLARLICRLNWTLDYAATGTGWV